MSVRITTDDLPLVTELAVGLARRMYEILGSETYDRNDIGPRYFHHMYMSTGENGCEKLWALGVARAAFGPEPHEKDLSIQAVQQGSFPKIFPPFFQCFQEQEIRAMKEAFLTIDWPSVTELLGAYLDAASDYGPDGSRLYTGRDLFDAPTQYLPELKALAREGYVQNIESRFQWTDQVRVAMHDGHVSPEVWGHATPK